MHILRYGRKKIKRKLVPPGKCEKCETENSISDAATILDDENIQLKVANYEFSEGPDFIALEVHYHHKCKRKYLNKHRNSKKEIAKINSSNIESKVKWVAIRDRWVY